MATLREIIISAQNELGEVPGTLPYRNPLMWEQYVRDAMDDLCRRSFCYYATFTLPVTASAATLFQGHCSSPLFRIEEARLTDAGGVVHTLGIVTPEMVQGGLWGAWYSTDWRSDLPTATPSLLVIAGGVNNARLYTAPNYSRDGALALTGYGTVSGKDQYGAYLVGLDDESPLPDRYDQCIRTGAKLKRAAQFPDQYGNRIPLLKSDWDEQFGMLNMESRSAARLTF